jgi:AcrR family transcriptional regulator
VSTPPSQRARGPKAVRTGPRELLDAALVVFARDGLQGASLRAIARQAGCDPSLIYYHFANKEAMFAALLEDRFPPLVAALERLVREPRDTAERIWLALATVHEHFHASAGFRSMVRGEIVRGAAGIQDLLGSYLAPAQRSIRAIFEEGIRLGRLRPDLDPVFLAFFLIRMEFEILDLVPGGTGPGPRPTLAGTERAWFDLFWRGVAAEPERPLPFLACPSC